MAFAKLEGLGVQVAFPRSQGGSGLALWHFSLLATLRVSALQNVFRNTFLAFRTNEKAIQNPLVFSGI
jgi:hypothetical protein